MILFEVFDHLGIGGVTLGMVDLSIVWGCYEGGWMVPGCYDHRI